MRLKAFVVSREESHQTGADQSVRHEPAEGLAQDIDVLDVSVQAC